MLAGHEERTVRVCADATRLPFAARSFDLVASSLMAGDVADLSCLLAAVARVLRQGGHVVYSDFHPAWSAHAWRRTFRAADGRDIEIPYHPHTVDDHLRALAAAGLRVRSIREPRVDNRPEPVVVVFHATRDDIAARAL
jgi:SAM-dependent methyltransferase